MKKLISKESVLEVAKEFTFTFAEERQRYMDFLEYCLNNANDNYKPLTNADRIRSMSNEWLARVIFSSCVEGMEMEDGCPHVEDMLNSEPSEPPISCEECILEWLKSEVGCE